MSLIFSNFTYFAPSLGVVAPSPFIALITFQRSNKNFALLALPLVSAKRRCLHA
jgi:hypothetical protein